MPDFQLQGADAGAAAGSSFGPWGSVIGGVLGYLGAQSTNEANQQNAQAQMDFQERMSNTAHQRETKDLIAAGLNPMLSALRSGATTPPGQMAQMQNASAAGVSSAAAAASIDQTKALTDKTRAEIELIKSQVPEAAQRIATGASSAGHLDSMAKNINTRLQAFDDEWNNIKEELYRIRSGTYRDTQTGIKASREADNLLYQLREILPQQAAKLKKETQLLGLKVPEAVAEAAFFSSPDAKSAMYFRHAPKTFTSALSGGVGAAADDVRDFSNKSRKYLEDAFRESNSRRLR